MWAIVCNGGKMTLACGNIEVNGVLVGYLKPDTQNNMLVAMKIAPSFKHVVHDMARTANPQMVRLSSTAVKMPIMFVASLTIPA